MHLDNSKLKSIFLVIVLIALLGYFIYPPLEKSFAQKGKFCGLLFSSDNRAVCLTEIAKTTKNSSYCAAIPSRTYRDSAGHYKEKCQFLTLPEVFSCEDYDCLIGTAEARKNISVCKTIPIQFRKDQCFSRVGVALRDQNSCSNIVDSHLREYFCMRQIMVKNNDLGGCKTLSERYQDGCYEDIAITRKDESVCSTLSNTSMDYGSRDSCYLNVAREKKDRALCEKIDKILHKSLYSTCLGDL